MVELSDIIKTVLAVLAILLLGGMLWLVIVLYNRTKRLQAALNVPDDSSDFSGITTYPIDSTAPIYYTPTRPGFDPRYPYGDTFNYDPRYTYDPRYPYEPRYNYNPPRYYPTYNGGLYYPTTFPQNATSVATTTQ